MAIRTTFYIDGFNFYHGIKAARVEDPHWKNYYWLDFVKFANQFLSEKHELLFVKYFTASPLQDDKEKRQSALFKANKYINGDKVQIIKGKYYKKKIRCLSTCGNLFTKYEEKRTDVNICVELMGDCLAAKTDLIILISADSDLVPPLEYIIRNFPEIKIKIFFPPKRKSTDLLNLMKSIGQEVVFLDSNSLKFKKSILPESISIAKTSVLRPREWQHPPAESQRE